jgi:ribokinase
VDVITPNVTEAEMLTGSKTGEERADKNIALDLIARGAKAAVLKLGARGSMIVTAEGEMARVPPYVVDIVDTTAAGDAFTAALAVGVAVGQDLGEATKFANAAGALACTNLGAQSAMPTQHEVRMLMADQPI